MTAVLAARLWKPDIFLSDVVMPDLNGIEAAIRIRAALATCKVLLLSGNAAAPGLMKNARREGYEFELLYKPIIPTELLARLRVLTEPPGFEL